MKPRVLIVDGHSMIFQWPDLTLQHAKRTAVARESLTRMLTGLQDNTDWHVTVVFDGNGVKPTEASCPHGIQVFYSTADQTADTVIERLAAVAPACAAAKARAGAPRTSPAAPPIAAFNTCLRV